jgi:hypothetical protein
MTPSIMAVHCYGVSRMLSVTYKPVILNVAMLSVVAPPTVGHLKGRLQPYPQTLDKAGKACREKTLLFMNIRKLRT